MKRSNKVPSVKLIFDRKGTSTSSNASNKKLGLVQVEIYWNRQRKYISTGIKVYKNQWNDNNENHVVNTVNATKYNNIIKNILNKIYDNIHSMSNSGDYSQLFIIDNYSTDNSKNLYDYAMHVIGRLNIRESSAKTYTSYASTIYTYGKFGRIEDITLSDIVYFEEYLTHTRRLSSSSQKRILVLLKHVLSNAVKDSIIQTNPMTAYRLPKAKTKRRIYLSQEQISEIASLELNNKIAKTRDMFLFQCYTGLSHSDLSSLNASMFEFVDDKCFIYRNRQKTGTSYRIMLLKPALEIAKRYDFKFDVPYLALYDFYLNKIAGILHYETPLSSHIGRHTFATWALSNGVPIEIVSKMLGHTSITTTQIYAKILAKDVEEQFKKLDKLF